MLTNFIDVLKDPTPAVLTVLTVFQDIALTGGNVGNADSAIKTIDRICHKLNLTHCTLLDSWAGIAIEHHLKARQWQQAAAWLLVRQHIDNIRIRIEAAL